MHKLANVVIVVFSTHAIVIKSFICRSNYNKCHSTFSSGDRI